MKRRAFNQTIVTATIGFLTGVDSFVTRDHVNSEEIIKATINHDYALQLKINEKIVLNHHSYSVKVIREVIDVSEQHDDWRILRYGKVSVEIDFKDLQLKENHLELVIKMLENGDTVEWIANNNTKSITGGGIITNIVMNDDYSISGSIMSNGTVNSIKY